MINIFNFFKKGKKTNDHTLNNEKYHNTSEEINLDFMEGTLNQYEEIYDELYYIHQRFDKKFMKISRDGLVAFINIEMHPNEVDTDKYEVVYSYFQDERLYILALNKEKVYDSKLKRLEVKVPKNFVGRVIGKGGRNIKEIEKSTGIRLKIKD